VAVSATRVFFGTYTDAESRGIYASALDLEAGTLTEPILVAETVSASFLALNRSGSRLYAVNEVTTHGGAPTGYASAFAVEGLRLQPIGSSPITGGASPCHIVLTPTEGHALVANYHGGSVAVLPIDATGALGEATAIVRHEGVGRDPERQEGPHAHSIHIDAKGRFVLAVDLGLDRIFVYRFDPETGGLTPHDPASAALPAGSGPRHLTFHPSGRYAFVDNELSGTVSAFRYDEERGRLDAIQTLSTLPAGFAGPNTSAEVAVSPDGGFVYVSNRGHDSIAVLRIDPETGSLALVGHAPTQGRAPRHFAIHPDGEYLVVANQDSGDVAVFRRHATTGALSPTGSKVQLSRPVCVCFAPDVSRRAS
jgi:6-phosphogluconolactonase